MSMTSSDPGADRLARLAAACGQAAGPLLLAAILAFDRLNPRLNPMADPISHLGASGAPYAGAFNAALALGGWLVAAFALGLGSRFRARGFRPWPATLIAAFGLLSLAGSAVFHCQAACDDSGLLGALHLLPTAAGLLALLVAMGLLPAYLPALRAGAALERLMIWAGQLAWVSTALYGLGALFPGDPLSPYVGLIQRLFIAVFAVWLFALATGLRRAIFGQGSKIRT